jgi:hypothetical protein
MPPPHSRLGATYYLTLQQNGQFCVEIISRNSSPTTVSNFATEAEAKEWIANHDALLAKSPAERRRAFYVVKPAQGAVTT